MNHLNNEKLLDLILFYETATKICEITDMSAIDGSTMKNDFDFFLGCLKRLIENTD